MPALERDLGLYAVLTVSVGAMVGSGIFVLPGLAAGIAGPAVVVAYLLAGLVVLPAAFSKSEMATAMPESGGTYLYIDRAMGPRLGTVAGLGAWFSLVFKSAFALAGLGAYLVLFAPFPPRPVALALAVLIVGVNVAGAKLTGRLQAVIVSVVVLALLGFVADGLTYVESARYHPFFSTGAGGVLAATGFVFVSYAGVTKIASVAEEIENPGRNIPAGMLGSVLVMMVLYTLVVFVVVGTADIAALDTKTPMAIAAESFAGSSGRLVISVVAVLALTSMANAGVLSSSRFPLAMSRDDLAPARLQEVSNRFGTPVVAIALTGSVVFGLIAFVPVLELAKLASAFQILVFVMVNVALVAFREGDLDSYDPEFVSPGYPWIQLVGIFGGLVLLTQMGALPMVGAIGIVLVGLLWYRVYGRERTEREGAAVDAIRRTTDDLSVEGAAVRLDATDGGPVVVAVSRRTDDATERALCRVAAAVVRRNGGRVDLVRFDVVPDQVTLSVATERTASDAETDREAATLADDLGVPVDVSEVVAHDAKHGVVTHVNDVDAAVVLGEWTPERFGGAFLGADTDWYLRHAPCDVVFVRSDGFDDVDDIAVLAEGGPYDPLEVLVADALAVEFDAALRFVHAVPSRSTDGRVAALNAYHDRLAELCDAPVETDVRRAADPAAELLAVAEDADLVVVSTVAHHLLYDVVFGTLPDRLTTDLDRTVVMAHSHTSRRATFLRYIIDRLVFQK